MYCNVLAYDPTTDVDAWTFAWTPADEVSDPTAQTVTIAPETTTVYTVEMVAPDGVVYTDDITITVYPVFSVITDAEVALCSTVGGQLEASVDVANAMDLYPTIAGWCGVDVPDDRTLDGRDLGNLLYGGDGPEEAPFFFMLGGNVEAVRFGRWKLHARKWNKERVRLYDLVDDIGERHDLVDEHPEVVAELLALISAARLEFGDDASEMAGSGVRPVGRVSDPVTLTTFDENAPYYMAEYDLPERG